MQQMFNGDVASFLGLAIVDWLSSARSWRSPRRNGSRSCLCSPSRSRSTFQLIPRSGRAQFIGGEAGDIADRNPA